MSLKGLYKATKFSILDSVKGISGLPYRRALDAAWSMSRDQILEYQSSAFRKIYDFSRENTPYYRYRRGAYPRLEGGGLPDWLRSLPILTKAEVRQHNSEFWSRVRLPKSIHSTSGTSGTPIRITGTIGERAFTQAVLESWYSRISGTRHPRTLALSGFLTPQPRADDLYWRSPCGRHVFVSIYGLRAANAPRLQLLIKSFKPQLYYGYASALHEFAHVVASVRPEGSERIFTVSTSEVLTENWRADIEAALYARVYNLYGCQEGTHIAFECEHRWLHAHPFAGIVEILDEVGAPARPGAFGRVVVTTLAKKSMPLFRYELGDVASTPADDSPCPCGLQWPRLGRIDGRSEDLVRTRDGRRIGYLLFHATKGLAGIKYAQLVQTDYERFTFNIIPATDSSVDRNAIESAMRHELETRLGFHADLTFRYVDEIPRSSRGKFKGVVVEI